MTNASARMWALRSVAIVQAEAGDFLAAGDTARTITVEGYKTEALAFSAMAQAESGDQDAAKEIIADLERSGSLPGPQGSDRQQRQTISRVFASVALAQIRGTFLDKAIENFRTSAQSAVEIELQDRTNDGQAENVLRRFIRQAVAVGCTQQVEEVIDNLRPSAIRVQLYVQLAEELIALRRGGTAKVNP